MSEGSDEEWYGKDTKYKKISNSRLIDTSFTDVGYTGYSEGIDLERLDAISNWQFAWNTNKILNIWCTNICKIFYSTLSACHALARIERTELIFIELVGDKSTMIGSFFSLRNGASFKGPIDLQRLFIYFISIHLLNSLFGFFELSILDKGIALGLAGPSVGV